LFRSPEPPKRPVPCRLREQSSAEQPEELPFKWCLISAPGNDRWFFELGDKASGLPASRSCSKQSMKRKKKRAEFAKLIARCADVIHGGKYRWADLQECPFQSSLGLQHVDIDIVNNSNAYRPLPPLYLQPAPKRHCGPTTISLLHGVGSRQPVKQGACQVSIS
jgi:hypothetical protein